MKNNLRANWLPNNWTPARWWRRSQPDNSGADYRDRISVATWVVVFGLGVSLLLEIPTTQIAFRALGSPITLSLTATTVMAMLLAVAAAAGTESIVRLHPQFPRRLRSATWAYWALPMAIASITVVLLGQVPTRLLQVIVMLLAGGLLAVAFYSLYATVEPGQPGFRRARFVLDALSYGAALLLFLFVYQARTRSLLSGTLVSITATLLAIEILRTSTTKTGLVLIYGAIVGLLLGQITWALNYWPLLPGLTGGLLLLLSFYLAVGIAQQGLQGRLTRRVLVEFGVFGAVALMLIVIFAPGI
jgi:Protein of unknown function (DUF5656)